MKLSQFLSEARTIAGEAAAKRGLTHAGHGYYADRAGNIVAKSVGSANPHNVVKASIDALLSQASPKLLSAMRGKKISEIVSKRENTK